VASIYADNFDVLITTTLDKVRPVLADQISNVNVLTAWLNMKSRITLDGGSVIRRPLLFAFNDTVGSYSGYDLIDTTPQEGMGWAEYNWKQQAGSVVISGEEVKKNSGPAQLINLLQAKVDQLKMSVADDFNAQLWASSVGNGGKDFNSIPTLVKSSGTVGNVAAATYTWWVSPTDATVDLTDFSGVNDMNAMYNTVHVNRSKVDIEVTTQAVFQAYEGLAVPNIRFQSLKAADLGFETVAHKTAEVVFDPDCPSGTLYMLNSERLEFVQHSDAWLTLSEFQRPYNQDAKVALITSMGELITDSRRSHGYLTSIVTS
jgi:hypothetical protein